MGNHPTATEAPFYRGPSVVLEDRAISVPECKDAQTSNHPTVTEALPCPEPPVVPESRDSLECSKVRVPLVQIRRVKHEWGSQDAQTSSHPAAALNPEGPAHAHQLRIQSGDWVRTVTVSDYTQELQVDIVEPDAMIVASSCCCLDSVSIPP